MLIKNLKSYSFHDVVSHCDNFFNIMLDDILAKVSPKDEWGDKLSFQNYKRKIVKQLITADTTKYSNSVISDAMHNALRKGLESVNNKQLGFYLVAVEDELHSQRQNEEPFYEEGFGIDDLLERKHHYQILNSEIMKGIVYALMSADLRKFYGGTEKFYANEQRTDGALFVEGTQPKNYSECDPNDMTSTEIF